MFNSFVKMNNGLDKTIKISVNDLFDELREENARLINDLSIACKCLQLLDKTFIYLIGFSENCKCIENNDNRLYFNDLENEYKSIVSQTTTSPEIKKEDNDSINSDDEVNDDVVVSTTQRKRKTIDYENCMNDSINEDNPLTINANDCYVKHCINKTMNKQQIIRNRFKKENKSVNTPKNSKMCKLSGNDVIKQSLGTGGYRCNFEDCDYSNPIKGNVMRHVKKMHVNKAPINCNKCTQRFWGQKRLIRHKRSSHYDNYNSDRKRYKCDWKECNFETKSISNLKVHKMRHTGDKPFKCDCGASFVNNSELKLHQLIHSDDFPFRCEWPGCEARFKIRDRLKRHFNWHTGDKPFKCEWPGCEATFNRNAELIDHKMVHEGVKNFACDWPECGMRFRRKTNLKLHLMVHRGDRPFKCEWPGCEARFRVPGKLNIHKLVHNEEPAYVCEWPECGKKLRTHWGLKLHLMAHRDERPFKCSWPQCDRRFVEKRRMENHFKTHK